MHNCTYISITMRKTKTILTLAIVIATSITFSLQSEPGGAPRAASGGPTEGGATCSQSGCHTGATITDSVFMTTNIPAEGYTPGVEYEITINVVGTGKKGFMFSAQKASGNFLGTIKSGTGSKITLNNYITHSSSKTSNPGNWVFNWTAPSAGSGSLSLYAAFAVTRNQTYSQSIAINENLASGIKEITNDEKVFTQYNPIAKTLNCIINTSKNSTITASLFNLNGQAVASTSNTNKLIGENTLSINTSALKQGIYLLQIQYEDKIMYKKIMLWD